MSTVLNAIQRFARLTPEACAIEGERLRLSYTALHNEIEQLTCLLRKQCHQSLGLLMDNGPAWVVADLAASAAGVTLVPIPAFFSAEQLQHTLKDSGIEAVITSDTALITKRFPAARARPLGRVAGQNAWLALLPSPQRGRSLQGVAKITYTSGTTGTPKGVCLSQTTMERVAASLRDAIDVTEKDRHLCLLPLAVLLENIGGLYTPLLAGATCVVPPLSQVGMTGATGLDPQRMLQAISTSRASSIILLPQMLQALVTLIAAGQPRPEQLRFIAVGGAPVSLALLEQARELGLPVFEGYGLSECASVVAVNQPGEQRPGSVGKPLPHVQLKFSAEGEILLKGNLFEGYLNHPTPAAEWYASGDLGYLDEDGFLYLTGRKKNCFITSFGRNVAPEWVEKELIHHPAIAQAVVYGEARPFNVALIVARGDEQQVEAAIRQANERLPDYAQVSAWLKAEAPFSVENHQLTATGRPRREEIARLYGEHINALYTTDQETDGASTPGRSQHGIL
jgi:long-chain acyl-CoA synthetase